MLFLDLDRVLSPRLHGVNVPCSRTHRDAAGVARHGKALAARHSRVKIHANLTDLDLCVA
eukprot:2522888-Rhodomonas_salina.1